MAIDLILQTHKCALTCLQTYYSQWELDLWGLGVSEYMQLFAWWGPASIHELLYPEMLPALGCMAANRQRIASQQSVQQ